jgi:hypothetical protein
MNRLLKKSYAPHFLVSGTVLAIGFSFAAAPASYWLLSALCGIAALAGVWLVGVRLAYEPVSRTARRAWQVTLILLLLVAAREFGGPAIAALEHRFGLDQLTDGLVLVTAFVALWLTSSLDEMPHHSRAMLWAGFLLHLVTTGLDLEDGHISEWLGLSHDQLGTSSSSTSRPMPATSRAASSPARRWCIATLIPGSGTSAFPAGGRC